jgi:concentrative nucleoside transporter, CNT family
MTYALCGFANFGSLGILLGGLNTLVPERRGELLDIGPKTLISGTIVACNTGAVVALVSLHLTRSLDAGQIIDTNGP